MKLLRRFSWFFKVKDWLRLKPLRGMMKVAQLKRDGVLAADKRWRPMPTGRNVML